ncbi:MAG TPA: hypothetical protein VLF95_05340 [Vicinamibacteria bacterium]|nr:hypothetical protein [Vicinamibacteria bacterium]
MRLATLFVCGLAVGLLGAPAAPAGDERPAAEDYTVRLEYLFWSPQPSGQLQKGLGGAEGTLLDVEDDLGFGEGGANAVRAAIRLGGPWKFRGSWSPLEFRGDVTAGKPFVYGTTVVREGDRVISSLLGNYVTAEVEWTSWSAGRASSACSRASSTSTSTPPW